MIKIGNKYTQLSIVFALVTIVVLLSRPAFAIDDGARALEGKGWYGGGVLPTLAFGS
jgi:hypothetical protein